MILNGQQTVRVSFQNILVNKPNTGQQMVMKPVCLDSVDHFVVWCVQIHIMLFN